MPIPALSSLEERVLVLVPTGEDAALTVSLLSRAQIGAEACADLAGLCNTLNEGAGVLVVDQEALVAPATDRLVEMLAHQPAWSDLPVIVLTSREGDERPGQRVLDVFGPTANVTLLECPFHATTLVALVQVALRSRRRQYEVRDLLGQREQLLESERLARLDSEAANRMKDEFLAVLSHELRTPLGAILGWTQVLRFTKSEDAELQQGLEVIERNANAQKQLIEDLLDVSRITSGKLRLESQLVHLADVIETAVLAVLGVAAQKRVEIHRDIDPSAGPVYGDPVRLQQVMSNLLTNAIKFTPEGGSIFVRLQEQHGHARISVSDTGIGIKPDFLPYVFDRFRQGDAGTTRKHGGLGLGLSIVRQLVDLHGGSISVDSAGEGKGTTFTVTLPFASEHVTETQLATPPIQAMPLLPADPTQLAGVKILVVDDEQDGRELVRRILEERGAIVQAAASAADALAELEQFQPNLLLSDIAMPGQDGYDLVREIRGSGISAEELPAVALTAFARSEDRQKAFQAGFQVHLAKPINVAELTDVIARLGGRVAAGNQAVG